MPSGPRAACILLAGFGLGMLAAPGAAAQQAYSTFLGGSGIDDVRGMAVDAAGNIYITGTTVSTTFPGVGGSSIQATNGGGTDVFVTKLDSTGTTIVYSTFLGGSGLDEGLAIAVDGAGNAYVTGDTTSPTFPGVGGGSIQPANAGLSDVFVTKLNPTGTAILYSTFLGGSGVDDGLAIAVDGAGNAYVTGLSFSSTFAGVSGASIQSANAGNFDVFVTKINALGTATVYSTFLGGSGDDRGLGIAVDSAGNAYVAGVTSSVTFPGVGGGSIQPVNAGGSDAFVMKINPAGTAIVYATFLGGSDLDEGRGIAVDSAGSAYVAGSTASTTFPGVNGSSLQPANAGGVVPGDGFVTKIDPSGAAILYSTFLGGSGADGCFGIAVDGAGSAYLTGGTASTTFPGVKSGSIQPVNAGGIEDAFVIKLDPTGTAIVYSTFLGGSDLEEGRGIGLDAAGHVYVAGFTSSATFPGVDSHSLQPANNGAADGFVTKISNAALAPAIPTLDPRGLGLLALLLASLGLLATGKYPTP